MFILITRRKGSAQAKLAEVYTEAVEAANKHAGYHNPTDGCSSAPIHTTKRGTYGSEYHVSRSSSFGMRSATVRPIGFDFETSIL